MVKNNDNKSVTVGVMPSTRDMLNSYVEQGAATLKRVVTVNEIILIMNMLSREKLQSAFDNIKVLEAEHKKIIYGGIE